MVCQLILTNLYAYMSLYHPPLLLKMTNKFHNMEKKERKYFKYILWSFLVNKQSFVYINSPKCKMCETNTCESLSAFPLNHVHKTFAKLIFKTCTLLNCFCGHSAMFLCTFLAPTLDQWKSVTCIAWPVCFSWWVCIHPLSIPLILNRVAAGAGADPSWHWASGGVQSVTGPTYRDRQPLTSTGNLESPINLHVFGLWEEAGENPQRHEENMQTPHRRAPVGRWVRTLLLWGDSASHCTTVLPLMCVYAKYKQHPFVET